MTTPDRIKVILAQLERRGSKKNRDGMAGYGIVAPKAFGVTVAALRAIGVRTGQDHPLALALWKTGWYEARMLTAFVGDPARLTVAQMDRWALDFDNWAICDALCFHLFDKSPHAFERIAAWSRRREEFVRRAAFALLAGVALHQKSAPDAPFLRALALASRAARDDRNFVKKGVSWGLRSVGHRNVKLHAATLALAGRLAASDHPTERWVGSDVIRDLSRPLVARKLKRRPPAR